MNFQVTFFLLTAFSTLATPKKVMDYMVHNCGVPSPLLTRQKVASYLQVRILSRQYFFLLVLFPFFCRNSKPNFKFLTITPATAVRMRATMSPPNPLKRPSNSTCTCNNHLRNAPSPRWPNYNINKNSNSNNNSTNSSSNNKSANSCNNSCNSNNNTNNSSNIYDACKLSNKNNSATTTNNIKS